eukprot:9891999-Lingulodinium_polyedra.AAC.1
MNAENTFSDSTNVTKEKIEKQIELNKPFNAELAKLHREVAAAKAGAAAVAKGAAAKRAVGKRARSGVSSSSNPVADQLVRKA